jgi:hypothetical protein
MRVRNLMRNVTTCVVLMMRRSGRIGFGRRNLAMRRKLMCTMTRRATIKPTIGQPQFLTLQTLHHEVFLQLCSNAVVSLVSMARVTNVLLLTSPSSPLTIDWHSRHNISQTLSLPGLKSRSTRELRTVTKVLKIKCVVLIDNNKHIDNNKDVDNAKRIDNYKEPIRNEL